MLYTLYEMQHFAMTPLRMWAQSNQLLFGNPVGAMLHHVPGGKELAASSELVSRLTRRYEKPPFNLPTTVVDGQTVTVTEEAALVKPFCTLRHFRRDTSRQDPKVLVVAPLSGHYATLLRDTVRALLPDHDVYITDWHDARLVPIANGPFHFDDYVHYVQEFIRHLSPAVHVVSVCQPTVPVLAAISLMAEAGEAHQPLTMTMMGGPIDTRIHTTEVNEFAEAHSMSWFERKVITRVPVKYPGYMRRVYPGFLQHAGFVAMNPDRHLQAHIDFYKHLIVGDGDSAEAHRKFYDEYNAVLDLPAEFYLDTIRMVFKHHLLPRGEMTVAGKIVKPSAITRTALFTVEGELDDISAPGQTEAAQDLCSGIPAERKTHFLMPGVGHYGIFSGRRWREVICPKVAEFIRTHA